MHVIKTYFIVISIMVLSLLIITPLNALAGNKYKAAPVFSDPDHVSDMGDGWSEKPIKYKPSVGDVKLNVLINQQVSSALLPLAEKFAAERKVDIEFGVGTCGISAGALSRKEVDMGGYCCSPGKIDRLPGLKFHTLGITPLLVLVNKDNPVENVSLQQARKLFSGELTNWQQVGGPDLPVTPLGMLHCKKRPGHWRMILSKANMYSAEFKVTGNINDTLSMVAGTPGGIGFEIIVNVRSFEMSDKVKALKIDGHDPLNLKRMRLGLYPFYRALGVTTWEGANVANPLADELADFMVKQTKIIGSDNGIVHAEALRKEGWQFKGNELVGDIK
jgi:phosphate transport system substrate-binding protein